MKIEFNNQTIEVTNEGTTIIIKAERGEYREDCWTQEPEEGELPYMLHDALAPIANGTNVRSYKEWRDLWYSGDKDQDRKDYEREQEAATRWKQVSDINPGELMDYLETEFNI